MRPFTKAYCLWIVGALIVLQGPIWEISTSGAQQVVDFGSSETPPFWSAHMPHNGMGGEILHAISDNSGISSRIIFFPTKRLIQMKTGNHLGDPEHWPDQEFVAIIPIATFRSSFYYYRPNHDKVIVFSGLDDLKGYTIGVIKRSIEDLSFFESFGIRIEESYKQESLFKKLKLGRIDLCGMVNLSGIRIIKKLFPDEIDQFGRIPLPSIRERDFHHDRCSVPQCRGDRERIQGRSGRNPGQRNLSGDFGEILRSGKHPPRLVRSTSAVQNSI